MEQWESESDVEGSRCAGAASLAQGNSAEARLVSEVDEAERLAGWWPMEWRA